MNQFHGYFNKYNNKKHKIQQRARRTHKSGAKYGNINVYICWWWWCVVSCSSRAWVQYTLSCTWRHLKASTNSPQLQLQTTAHTRSYVASAYIHTHLAGTLLVLLVVCISCCKLPSVVYSRYDSYVVDYVRATAATIIKVFLLLVVVAVPCCCCCCCSLFCCFAVLLLRLCCDSKSRSIYFYAPATSLWQLEANRNKTH